jgi:hypothetical protein
MLVKGEAPLEAMLSQQQEDMYSITLSCAISASLY